MIENCQIFARANPTQKADIILELENNNKNRFTGMCGDGANDCIALKISDVSLSLSETEASVAAPFTSKIKNISSFKHLINEGKGSIVTTFVCFKFMIIYGLIYYCFTSLLYMSKSMITDYESLWVDFCIVLPLATFMGNTKC